MDSAKLQETRRAAREWAESFKVGDKVEVLATKTRQPAIVFRIEWVRQWPVLWLKWLPSDYRFIWYRERKTIRKLNEEGEK